MESSTLLDLAHLYNGDKILIASNLEKLPIAMRRLCKSPAKKQ
jgi:hypothetical protein